MIEVRRATAEEARAHPSPKGVWAPLTAADGRKSASIVCPNCGRWGVLLDHVILDDGTVRGPPGQSGSVVCGYACGFHDTVRLMEWNP